jgi:hypothetical protein
VRLVQFKVRGVRVRRARHRIRLPHDISWTDYVFTHLHYVVP